MSTKRIGFLKKKFNVIGDDALLELNKYVDDKVIVLPKKYSHINNGNLIAISFDDHKGKPIHYFSDTLLNKLLVTDPTKNKIYVQWLLNLCISKADDRTLQKIFGEDMEKLNNDLVIFDDNKRKKRFKELCVKNYATKELKDPTNINQYNSESQLYDAVYPFREHINLSDLENTLIKFEEMGQAEIPVKNDRFTIFIPKTLAASEIFNFTNWCTSVKGNSMFKTYRNYKTLNNNGKLVKSDMYIIIDNEFFNGNNDKIYQVHFESNQIMDKDDSPYKDIFRDFISKDISVKNFFFETLSTLYCNNKPTTNYSSKYLEYYKNHIIKYDFTKILFDNVDVGVRSLVFRSLKINEIPNLDKFKSLRILFLEETNLSNLGDNKFANIEGISVPHNNLTELSDLSQAKKLKFLNIKNNPISDVSENNKYLDISMGGSLEMLSMDITDSDGEESEIYRRLKILLPNVYIS